MQWSEHIKADNAYKDIKIRLRRGHGAAVQFKKVIFLRAN